jgi:pantoate--beta-alanine ligase
MAAEIGRLKKKGCSIGFVPTMGYLHEGHASLLGRGRKENDILIMSIFVNPIQFGPKEDFKRYPRNFRQDKEIAKREKVDIIFYPSAKAIYHSDFCTYIDVERLTEGLCGAKRPGHFRGVATVVTKLFNIIRPDTAYFGRKDAQQAVVIKQMVKDLNIPVKIKVLPILRGKDGLAVSSRNSYLNEKERKAAVVLIRSLKAAGNLVKEGIRDAVTVRTRIVRIIAGEKLARIDYIEIVHKENLEKLKRIKKGHTLIALAVYIGKTRLIDNMIV